MISIALGRGSHTLRVSVYSRSKHRAGGTVLSPCNFGGWALGLRSGAWRDHSERFSRRGE